ncbi:MAG: SDR family oxidoreductase [Oscillochloridaceae bacterium umkhey_bin13]
MASDALRAPFLTCRAVLPAMLARGDGLIINLVATDDLPGMATYAASKQGLVGLTRSLAGELGAQGVRIVAVALEPTDTPGQRANAALLAPRLGLTPEQFLGVSLHPAYNGPMPPADAGAAVAYLIAGGGAGYHGALVSVYTLLERAGLIAPPQETNETSPDDYAHPTGARLARALSAQLHAEISATRAEFSLLPIVARPLVHNQLRLQTGQSLQDWDATIADLERQLAHLETNQDPMVSFALQTRRTQLREGLALLQHYYARVPQETARYSSDRRFLRQIQQIAERRVKLIDDLISALERV